MASPNIKHAFSILFISVNECLDHIINIDIISGLFAIAIYSRRDLPKRLLLMIPTLLGVLTLTFAVVQFVPGGPMAGHTESKTTDAGPHLHLALQEYKAAQTALEWLSLQLVKTELGRRMVKLAEAQQAMLADGFRWLVGEARLRLDLNEAEGSALMDLVGEMMQRLDRIESGAKVS